MRSFWIPLTLLADTVEMIGATAKRKSARGGGVKSVLSFSAGSKHSMHFTDLLHPGHAHPRSPSRQPGASWRLTVAFSTGTCIAEVTPCLGSSSPYGHFYNKITASEVIRSLTAEVDWPCPSPHGAMAVGRLGDLLLTALTLAWASLLVLAAVALGKSWSSHQEPHTASLSTCVACRLVPYILHRPEAPAPRPRGAGAEEEGQAHPRRAKRRHRRHQGGSERGREV